MVKAVHSPVASNEDACEVIADRISVRLGEDCFNQRFASVVVLRVEDDGVCVVVRTEFHARVLEKQFGQAVRDAAQEVLGCDDVRWLADRDAFSDLDDTSDEEVETAVDVAEEPVDVSVNSVPSSGARSHGVTGRLRLSNFVVGDCNRMAYNAAERFVESDAGLQANVMFLQGVCGVGKTHLLQGIALRYLEMHPNARVRYTTGERFTNEFIAVVKEAREGGNFDSFRERYRRVDLLCIDDVHFIGGKNSTQNEFLHTFEQLKLDGAKLVLASDGHPKQIANLSQAIVSRCVSGMVLRMERPDPETRYAIARQFIERRGLLASDDALRAIARAGAGSVRELEGVVTRVEAMYCLMGGGSSGMIDGAFVERVLRETGGAQHLKPIKTEFIAQVVCDRLGVEMSDLLGPGRHKRVVLARAMC
ncbi:MAG: DnaA/Hda family protein, partial [Planctomycetota bacterium]